MKAFHCIPLCSIVLAASIQGNGSGAPRQLAPGVLTVIPPDRDLADTFSGPRELVEISRGVEGLDWQPHFSPNSQTLKQMAQIVVFRREVWCLEFAFKPMRTTYVDFAGPNGQSQRRLVWYLVYRIRNPGFHLNPATKEDQWGHELYAPEPVNHSVRFFPRFVLESLDQRKAYIDRVLPTAVKQIQSIEDAQTKLYNSVEISELDIAVSTDEADHGVWGVATWDQVDPHTDFVALFIQRLTNAYRFEDPQGGFQRGDAPGSGRVYAYKTLQLNFWRPGDEIAEHQDEIRYGMPSFEDVQGRVVTSEAELVKLYRVTEPTNHLWVYRP